MLVDLISHTLIYDLLFATLLAFGADRAVAQYWRGTHPKESEGLRSTVLYGATHSIVISARIYLILIVAELILDRFPAISVLPEESGITTMSLREAAPSVAFCAWGGMTACIVKRVILIQSVAGKTLGRVALFDRLMDFVIFLVTIMTILDQLKIDMSGGLQTILSFGGIGALAFSLASKDLVEQIVGGFAINAWDAFDKGDKIRLGDGTEGIILEIGLLETLIQQFDNIVVRIPNSQLTTARVMNLSRVKKSRLTQELRFKYSDLDKLPAVLDEIKQEIRLSCPKLISDGSKPFRAVLVEYKSDHIQGQVMAHFDIQPSTGEYVNNRQEFVLAIARAMKKHDVEFAMPSIVYHGSNTAK